MNTLYSKVGFLKRINQPSPKVQAKQQQQKQKYPDLDLADMPDDNEDEEKEEKEKIDYFKLIYEGTFKLLMSLKNASFSYNESNGTMIPGFKPTPTSLGMDWANNAPGLGFVFGDQTDIRDRLVRDSLLSRDSLLNLPYASRYNNNLNLRATLEPIKSFRIELTATRSYSSNRQEYYRFDPENNSFRSYSPTETGNFSITLLTWNTAFIKDNEDFSNATFDKFKEYRKERLK